MNTTTYRELERAYWEKRRRLVDDEEYLQVKHANQPRYWEILEALADMITEAKSK